MSRRRSGVVATRPRQCSTPCGAGTGLGRFACTDPKSCGRGHARSRLRGPDLPMPATHGSTGCGGEEGMDRPRRGPSRRGLISTHPAPTARRFVDDAAADSRPGARPPREDEPGGRHAGRPVVTGAASRAAGLSGRAGGMPVDDEVDVLLARGVRRVAGGGGTPPRRGLHQPGTPGDGPAARGRGLGRLPRRVPTVGAGVLPGPASPAS